MQTIGLESLTILIVGGMVLSVFIILACLAAIALSKAATSVYSAYCDLIERRAQHNIANLRHIKEVEDVMLITELSEENGK
jgi:hypothetical protein